MVRSLYAIGGSFQYAGFCLCVSYQFFQGFPFSVFLNYNNTGLGQMVADGNDALIIKRSIGLNCQGSISREVDETDGISVRFRFGQFGPADLTVGTGFVFNNHGLAYIRFGIIQQQAGACIRTGTGLIRDNDFDILCGFPFFVGISSLLVTAATAAAARHQDRRRQHQGPCYSKNFFHEFLLLHKIQFYKIMRLIQNVPDERKFSVQPIPLLYYNSLKHSRNFYPIHEKENVPSLFEAKRKTHPAAAPYPQYTMC